MKFTTNIEIKEVVSAEKLADNALKSLVENLNKDMLLLHAAAVKSIQSESGGELTKRYNPSRYVTASKPGDPPNTDLGTFVRSIQMEPATEQNPVAKVGTNDPRGAWFEFGTQTMAKRPWLGPALQMVQDKLGQYKIELG